MADTFGAVELPLAATTSGPVSDPAIEYLAQFVAAVLNRHAAAAWATVDPRNPPVKRVFTHDPEKIDVSDSDFPCVFVWRSDSKPEWVADDYTTDVATFTIMWLFEPLPQAAQRKRAPFLNGILKPLYRAFSRGRDPAWVLQGDTDTGAATRGTVLWWACGILRERIQKAELDGLVVDLIDGGKLRSYDGISITLEAEERLFEDPALYAGGTTASRLVADITNPEEDVLLQVQDPIP